MQWHQRWPNNLNYQNIEETLLEGILSLCVISHNFLCCGVFDIDSDYVFNDLWIYERILSNSLISLFFRLINYPIYNVKVFDYRVAFPFIIFSCCVVLSLSQMKLTCTIQQKALAALVLFLPLFIYLYLFIYYTFISCLSFC